MSDSVLRNVSDRGPSIKDIYKILAFFSFSSTPMSTFVTPFPLVDVHFIWSHFNTAALSSDTTSIYSSSVFTASRPVCLLKIDFLT